jgi:hypothetical protein
MADFESYYWRTEDLDPTDASAATVLIETNEPDDAVAAFERLLTSDRDPARCLALDHYAYAEVRGRFGSSNPFSRFTKNVLDIARAQLERPAVTATSPRGTVIVGANHASALGVLSHIGDAADLERITRFLDPVRDLNVIEEACMAADHCLPGADVVLRRKAGAQLAALFQDPSLIGEVRIMAVRPFLESSLDQDAALLDTMTRGPFPLAAYAAWALVDRIPDVSELRRVVATWPDDAPYPADEVRELLKRR